MAYQRKTKDVWHVEADYGQGWEFVCGGPWRMAKDDLKEHRENQPEFDARMVMKREPV